MGARRGLDAARLHLSPARELVGQPGARLEEPVGGRLGVEGEGDLVVDGIEGRRVSGQDHAIGYHAADLEGLHGLDADLALFHPNAGLGPVDVHGAVRPAALAGAFGEGPLSSDPASQNRFPFVEAELSCGSIMEPSIHKRRKILLHFFLGIGLPSLLLGYLAFRGIQNDQALLERERLNEYRAIAQRITTSIDEHILMVEQAFLDSIGNHQGPQNSALLHSLTRLENEQPVVEELFIFDSAKHIQLPLAELLFLPDGDSDFPSAQPRSVSLLREIRDGQQYEFQQHHYRKAIASYRQAFAHVSSQEAKAEVLNAIARVQKKSAQFRDATQSYRAIVQDYSRVRMRSGIPSGLVARLELGSLLPSMNDSLGAVQTLIGLYEDLIHREWLLEKSQYEFFVRQVGRSLEDIFSQVGLPVLLQPYQSAFRTLEDEDRKRREITERLLTFQAKATPRLLANVPRNTENHTLKRFSLTVGGHTYLVSLPGKREENGKKIWGLLLNSEHLKANVLQPLMQRLASPEEVQWAVRGPHGEVVLKSDVDPSPAATATVRTNFAGNFPPWSLALYHQEPRLFETLLTSRRGVYFYMFILLAGILAFGLSLTIRAVSHELELGKMKSDFVSTISHEFKSPLTSIRQLAEMLQSGRVPSEVRRRHYL